MKYLGIFAVLISCLMYSTAQEPSVYVQVSWDMPWSRLCDFLDYFTQKLAEHLYETRVLIPYEVEPVRIRFMNADSHCKGNGNEEDAILDFFVSKSEMSLGYSDVDKNLTILAYIKLYDYWKNKKMVLLDAIFMGKVDKVELKGKDKPDISEGLSESTRIAIAIIIGLTVVSLIAGISVCVNLKRKVKKPAHGVPIRTEIPLHVIRPEPYEPTITTADSPPAYDFDRKYEFDRPHGFDPGRDEFGRPDWFYRTDEFDRRDDLDRRDFFVPPDGFDRRDDFGYRDDFDRKDEFDIGYAKYNGYTDHNMAYDDEPLGSPML